MKIDLNLMLILTAISGVLFIIVYNYLNHKEKKTGKKTSKKLKATVVVLALATVGLIIGSYFVSINV